MALKTLHNCKPTEFVRQTSRIKKSVKKWLTDTDVANILRRMPQVETVTATATDEERAEVIKRNKELLRKQSQENLSDMLDAMLDDHPDETLEVLALCCFVEPEHVNDHEIREYLAAFTELISDEAVIGFFTSLMQLGQMDILTRSKQ